MLTHVSLSLHLVWEDVLWSVVALYEDGDGSDPVAIYRSGRAPVGAEDSPQALLQAAVHAMTFEIAESSEQPRTV